MIKQKPGTLVRLAREIVGLSAEEARSALAWDQLTLARFEKDLIELSTEELSDILEILFDISVCDFYVIMEVWTELSPESRLAAVYAGIISLD